MTTVQDSMLGHMTWKHGVLILVASVQTSQDLAWLGTRMPWLRVHSQVPRLVATQSWDLCSMPLWWEPLTLLGKLCLPSGDCSLTLRFSKQSALQTHWIKAIGNWGVHERTHYRTADDVCSKYKQQRCVLTSCFSYSPTWSLRSPKLDPGQMEINAADLESPDNLKSRWQLLWSSSSKGLNAQWRFANQRLSSEPQASRLISRPFFVHESALNVSPGWRGRRR